jgi:hypothetical protein
MHSVALFTPLSGRVAFVEDSSGTFASVHNWPVPWQAASAARAERWGCVAACRFMHRDCCHRAMQLSPHLSWRLLCRHSPPSPPTSLQTMIAPTLNLLPVRDIEFRKADGSKQMHTPMLPIIQGAVRQGDDAPKGASLGFLSKLADKVRHQSRQPCHML